jgi:2-polyprenyl-3-methyl-5-hydroxy-6-metoxy-1,4-benzoquinol methylase
VGALTKRQAIDDENELQLPITTFEYSEEFRNLIVQMHTGKEHWPNYQSYLNEHLGGPESRFSKFTKYLIPEIEYHCGSLKGKKILDYGCGTGSTTAALAARSDSVVAFDIDKQSVEICRRRIGEHGLEGAVKFYCASHVMEITAFFDSFDIILMNGVLEHIPLSVTGARRKAILSLLELLSYGGCLVVSGTPNRLYPFDFHSTQLWWIPWTRPGSAWAYRRAVKKRRHSDVPTISPGPLGLEEVGAWGATFWEIKKYLNGQRVMFVNTQREHDRHSSYVERHGWKRDALESVVYYIVTRPFGVPITAFTPYIMNLVVKKY